MPKVLRFIAIAISGDVWPVFFHRFAKEGCIFNNNIVYIIYNDSKIGEQNAPLQIKWILQQVICAPARANRI